VIITRPVFKVLKSRTLPTYGLSICRRYIRSIKKHVHGFAGKSPIKRPLGKQKIKREDSSKTGLMEQTARLEDGQNCRGT
jgi:hypothetical protein